MRGFSLVKHFQNVKGTAPVNDGAAGGLCGRVGTNIALKNSNNDHPKSITSTSRQSKISQSQHGQTVKDYSEKYHVWRNQMDAGPFPYQTLIKKRSTSEQNSCHPLQYATIKNVIEAFGAWNRTYDDHKNWNEWWYRSIAVTQPHCL